MAQCNSKILQQVIHGLVALALLLQPQLVSAVQSGQLTLHGESSTVNSRLAAPKSQSAFRSPQSAIPLGVDVRLQAEGVLDGQLVDPQGQPIEASELLICNGRQTWLMQSDSAGRFQVSGLKGGTYKVQSAQQTKLVRAWVVGTAPPNAAEGLLLVRDADVVRGQRRGSYGYPLAWERLKYPLANPWVFGGIVATAVAIPVAIHNADDDHPPPVEP